MAMIVQHQVNVRHARKIGIPHDFVTAVWDTPCTHLVQKEAVQQVASQLGCPCSCGVLASDADTVGCL